MTSGRHREIRSRVRGVWTLFFGLWACSDYEVKQIQDPPLAGESDTANHTLYSDAFLDTAALERCARQLEPEVVVSYDESCAREAQTGSIESVVEWEISQLMDFW